MSLFLIVLAATLVGLGAVEEDWSPEAKKMHDEVEKACQVESGLTDEDLAEAMKGNIGNNLDKLKVHSFCFFKKYDFMSESGLLLVDNIKKHFYENDGKDIADQITTKCLVQKESPLDTALALSTCMMSVVYSA